MVLIWQTLICFCCAYNLQGLAWLVMGVREKKYTTRNHLKSFKLKINITISLPCAVTAWYQCAALVFALVNRACSRCPFNGSHTHTLLKPTSSVTAVHICTNQFDVFKNNFIVDNSTKSLQIQVHPKWRPCATGPPVYPSKPGEFQSILGSMVNLFFSASLNSSKKLPGL